MAKQQGKACTDLFKEGPIDEKLRELKQKYSTETKAYSSRSNEGLDLNNLLGDLSHNLKVQEQTVSRLVDRIKA
jgi:hypothetical protein